MSAPRFHPGFEPGGGSCAPRGGRLNLLLSKADWTNDPWADHLPRLLEPMGVSSICARSAKEAEAVIRTQPIHIAVVDLSLPMDDRRGPDGSIDEAGPRILELLSRLASPPPTVVLRRPHTRRNERAHMQAALRCGAFSVVDASSANLESMLSVMQRVLARFYQNRWPDPRGLV